jgi:acetyl esterase
MVIHVSVLVAFMLVLILAWLVAAPSSHQVGGWVAVTLAGRVRARLLRVIVPLFANVSSRIGLAHEDVEVMSIPVTSGFGTKTVTLYRPADPRGGPWPVHFSFHGGGYATGSPRQDDAICRHLAVHARCVVASIEYPLAPEHRYPAALTHSLAAMRYVLRQAATWRLDPLRVTLGGFSAGGGLAAALAQRVRDEGSFNLGGQVLIYPWLDLTWTDDPVREPGMGHALPPSMLPFFRAMYLPRLADRHVSDASPLHAPNLVGLPPTCVITGGLDLIRAQSELYVERLRKAGVEAEYHEFDDADHGFTHSGPVTAARDALASMVAAVSRFHKEGRTVTRPPFGVYTS